ncbi:kunitz trypsin inhibitor 5-like [Zingiber officinale]|nr:kunitz trypsin inhibitor 5-like [Zingiber officinale]
MKVLVVLCFLLCSASAEATIFASVRDTDGRSLRPSHEYYILPLFRGRGGGLTLAAHSNESSFACPLAVAQERSEVDSGLPVIFSPAPEGSEFVKMSTDLHVRFSAATICVQSTVWQLGDVDASTGRRYVISGGVEGSPSAGTASNWFKIERYGERDYKLVHCPSVCQVCKVVCGDVGVFVEGGKRWLGLDGDPFSVIFKNAHPGTGN